MANNSITPKQWLTDGMTKVIAALWDEIKSAFATKTALAENADEHLIPIDVRTVTPASTFPKNAAIGIGGVLYRAKRATASMPLTIVVSDGKFVTHEVNGQLAFVVQSAAVNADWEVWMDAGMAYAYSLADQRITNLEQALPAVKTTADSALQPETTFVTEGGTSYTAAQLLQAVAELMGKNLVTQ